MHPIPLPAPPRNVLIIKPSAIGDVVHGLPVLNLLRRRWADAKISWLVTPACAGILHGHPMLHEVIHFDRKEFAKAWRSWRTFKALRAFTRGLRDRRFDLTIDLQGLLRSGWLAGKTRAPVRVGLSDAREGATLFYTHRVPTAPGAGAERHAGAERQTGAERHAVDRYLCVTDALGCGCGPVEFPFPTDAADRAHVAALLPPSPYAVLMPGTNWETKRWPVERFAGLVAPLREKFGLSSVVAGGPADGPLAAPIEQAGALNLAGRTTLRQLVALLERAALVVANDSGPMHVAAALGRPLVTPFGPTSPARTGPYGRTDSVIRLDIPCSPCFSRTCSHQSCLRWLGTSPVLDLAEHQMQGSAEGRTRNDEW